MSAAKQLPFYGNDDDAFPMVSAGFDRTKILELLRHDLNFFAPTVIPDTFKFLFPQIHQEVWELLKKYVNQPKSFFRLALGLPRGHAKTTLIKLFIVYCILFTNKKFVLIVGSSAARAEDILADVVDMLGSQNVVQIFGNWKLSCEKDTQSVKKFTFLGRSVVLAALGAGASLRGLNLKNERPDVIICDDVQSAEDVESEVVSGKLLSWILGTLFKAKSPSGCLYIYIGNMFRGPNCILAKFKKSREWISFIVGALLDDGNSIWPELHSPEDLLAELRHDMDLGKPEIFFAEVQNDPDAGISSHFDISKVPDCPYNEHDLILGGFIIIDVSGTGKNADDTAIGYFALIEDKVVFKDLVCDTLSPLQAIEAAIQLAFKHNCPYIFIEAVAYQASFLFWFNHLCEQRGITGFQLYEIYPRGQRKVKRIINFFKQMLNAEILLWHTVRTQVLYQAANYKPNKTDNVDDVLDLGAYVDTVLSDYAPMLGTGVNEILGSFKNDTKTLEDSCAF